MMDRAAAEWPGVEFVLSVPHAESLLLPRHADRLLRWVGGHPGYFSGHVYRDTLIEPFPAAAAITCMILNPLGKADTPLDAPTYIGDLVTGQVTVRVPPSED